MYETILVGTDGSDHAQRALEHAVELANATDATLHVVTVVDTQSNPMKFGVAEIAELNRAKTDLVEEISGADGDIAVEGKIRRGEPHELLLEVADEIDADLIVVGQSKTSNLQAAIFGSTTERLTRETRVPLTVVPLPTDSDSCD